ncbi:MAG: secondary thiamine-phosphate synthase enzyme YjbQ [Halobacteriota archaeon]|nr:secondary thiamine-phosphate synthase enzyme YjbQ [Halobacteriota archaeon]
MNNKDGTMNVHTGKISIKTKGNSDVVDITDEARNILGETGLKDGILTLFVTGSTGAITTIEYEPGVVEDLRSALERLIPKGIDYKHNLRWGDGNGHSHVRASLLGPSLTVPFVGGDLQLGTWQQIIFIDLDNRPRSRDVLVQIIG